VGVQTGPVLEEDLGIAYMFAVSGQEPADSVGLLRAIEIATAQEEPVDDGSVIAVQDCWICADVCIRTLPDGDYTPGLAAE
jgi:hypothetical protein